MEAMLTSAFCGVLSVGAGVDENGLLPFSSIRSLREIREGPRGVEEGSPAPCPPKVLWLSFRGTQ